MKRTTTPVHCAFLARFLHAIQFVRYDTFLARYATFFVYESIRFLCDTIYFLEDTIRFKCAFHSLYASVRYEVLSINDFLRFKTSRSHKI